MHHALAASAPILYGGNFAVRREALERIGGFDRSIEFHGEDTNLGRRLTPRRARSTSRATAGCGRRRAATGRWASGAVFGLYVRNFWSEILRHRPADGEHLDVRG